MKKLLTFIAVSCCALIAQAQQDVLLSQYMFNPLVLNPAYAGSKDYMQATAVYRKQWAGWGDGSPETQAASFHGPLKNRDLGLGFSLIHDAIGVTDRLDLNAAFAYHMQVAKSLRLGLGIQAGFSNYSFKAPSKYWDQNDPLYTNLESSLLPNFGVGAFLRSEKFYVGLSVPHLLDYDSTKAITLAATDKFQATRHYFATTGYVFDGNPDVVVKPSVLMKYVPNAPVEFDFNVNVLFINTFWLGVSYRTEDAIVGIVELQISKKLRIGYSYDFTTTDVGNYSDGSHEIMLAYDFGYDIMKMKTPRYF